MRIFPTVVKRINQVVSGDGAQFLPGQKPGARLRSLLSATARSASGIRASIAPFTVTTRQRPALTLASMNSGEATLQARAAPRASNRNSGTARPPQKAAGKIVQVTYDLTHRRGAASAAAVSGSSAWTNTANAAGNRNGTVATGQGNLSGARNYHMDLAYADFADKAALTILGVRLHFYLQQAGTALGNGDLRLGWAKAGVAQPFLQIITGNVNFLTNPVTFDLTALGHALTWADLDSLSARVQSLMGMGENLITTTVDAVELEVIAELTEVP